MWFVYAQFHDDQTQKDFLVFHVFLEVIFITRVLKAFLKNVKFFVLKNNVYGHFAFAFEILKKF